MPYVVNRLRIVVGEEEKRFADQRLEVLLQYRGQQPKFQVKNDAMILSRIIYCYVSSSKICLQLHLIVDIGGFRED